MAQPRKLGEILVENGFITREQLEEALAEQPRYGLRLGRLLERVYSVDDEAVAVCLSQQAGAPLLRGEWLTPSTAVRELLRPEDALAFTALPLETNETSVRIAVADPTNRDALAALEARIGCPLVVGVAPYRALRMAIIRAYGLDPSFEAIHPDAA